MASTVSSSLVDVVASNHTLVTTVDKLDGHVSSFEDRLTAVKSTLKKVEHSTTTMVTHLQDVGTSLTSVMAQPPPVPQDSSPLQLPALPLKGPQALGLRRMVLR